MAFTSTALRVLIASPSDLPDERQAATDAVNDWNALHAASEGVVLLPVKWESHGTPEAGLRPQAVINRDLVEPSDILIGLFWTKFGTSTGVAESGTVEEIDLFVKAGKPTMLYFSSRPIDPNKIDVVQHQRLKKFKNETYSKALCGGFNDLAGLKASLHKDLTNTVRRLRQGPKLQPESHGDGEELESLAQQQRDDFEAKILQDKFRSFKAPRGIVAVSIIPAMPLKTTLDLGPTQEPRLRRMLVPMRGEGASFEPYGRSVVSTYPALPEYLVSQRPPPMSVTELTEAGSIYAADNWLYPVNDPTHEPRYRMNIYQPQLVHTVQRYLTGLRELGVIGTLYVGVSMLRAGRFKLSPHDDYNFLHDGLGRGSSGDDIRTQTITIRPGDDTSSFEAVTSILHKAFWHIWREAGHRTVPAYDLQGNILHS